MAEIQLHMNGGSGENSYANNSSLQKMVISKTREILEDAIERMMQNVEMLDDFRVADLGCSSGPNSLLAISIIINSVDDLCMKMRRKTLDFHVSLNDLFENDFNTVFKSLPSFYRKMKIARGCEHGHCFISGVAGSFYERLFQRKSLHFVFSSYSLHWLSQVPKGIENNKENIYIAKTSPPNVHEEYLKQFRKDFFAFLRARSMEMVDNGHMVLTFLARITQNPRTYDSCRWFKLIAKSLKDMVNEGLVSEAEFHSFNIPLYAPSIDEVMDIVKEESSFVVNNIDLFGVDWDENHCKCEERGEVATKTLRAVYEPLLVTHFRFDESAVDYFFKRFENYVAEHLATEESKFFTLVMSMALK